MGSNFYLIDGLNTPAIADFDVDVMYSQDVYSECNVVLGEVIAAHASDATGKVMLDTTNPQTWAYDQIIESILKLAF